MNGAERDMIKKNITLKKMGFDRIKQNRIR